MDNSLPNPKNLISISEAAKFLNVSIDTIRRWDKSGVLHSQRPDGKNRYFSLVELQEHQLNQPLSISETSKLLGLSPTTLRRLEAKGVLIPSRNNVGERVYQKDLLEIFLKSGYLARKKHLPTETRERVSKPQLKAIPPQPKDPILNTSNDNIVITTGSSIEDPLPITVTPVKRIPEILAAITIFCLLVSIGITNILQPVISGPMIWSIGMNKSVPPSKKAASFVLGTEKTSTDSATASVPPQEEVK
jgi:excisionase family DNA binding protein